MFKIVRSPEDESARHYSAHAGDARLADMQRFVAAIGERAATTGRHGSARLGRDEIGRDEIGRDEIGRDEIGRDRIDLDRIDGLDRTGTALAVVDSMGRFVDIGLRPGWWAALGPSRVAVGLIEALVSARMKAALVPLIIRGKGIASPCARLADACRVMGDGGERPGEQRVFAGPRGLFRLCVRGGHIEGAQLDGAAVTADDGERLVADARDAIGEWGRRRAGGTFDFREAD